LDAGIIRNRLKIKSAKTNAITFIEVQKEFGTFSKYLWDFVDGKPIQNNFTKMSEMPAHTPLSDKISKDLKSRGFKFIGLTIVLKSVNLRIIFTTSLSCFHQLLGPNPIIGYFIQLEKRGKLIFIYQNF